MGEASVLGTYPNSMHAMHSACSRSAQRLVHASSCARFFFCFFCFFCFCFCCCFLLALLACTIVESRHVRVLRNGASQDERCVSPHPTSRLCLALSACVLPHRARAARSRLHVPVSTSCLCPAVYWALMAMDLMDQLDQMPRNAIVAWVLSCQCSNGTCVCAHLCGPASARLVSHVHSPQHASSRAHHVPAHSCNRRLQRQSRTRSPFAVHPQRSPNSCYARSPRCD
jgi:hypothetical protein